VKQFVRKNQFGLLARRSFGPLWLAHYASTFGDQLVRGALAGMLAGVVFLPFFFEEKEFQSGVWLIVPGLLLAAYAGQLADCRDPRRLVIISRLLGVVAAGTAAAALYSGQPTWLFAAAALAGAQEALFVPARGRLVRAVLTDQELAGGNGLILTGWQLGALGVLVAFGAGSAGEPGWLAGTLLLVAVVGLVASLMIPPSGIAPRRASSWTPAAVHRGTLAAVFKDRNLLLAVLGVGWFWFTKITYLVYLPEHAAAVFGLARAELTLVLAVPITGIAVGALLCSPASGRRIELGLVPLGALLMAVTGLDFFFATTGNGPPAFGRGLIDLFLLGTGSGLFVVPLMAWIIQAAPRARLGRVQGGMYLCVVLFLAVALGITDWAHDQGIEVGTLMLTSTLLHAAVSIYIFMLLPEFLLRLVMWVLVHTIYRVREEGLDNVPLRGPAVVVCNHVSYLDALVIGAKLRRPVRFVMHKHIFKVPVLGLLFRLYKAIPIASGKTDPETLKAALDQVAAELEAGQLVGIFPEGHLTHDGELDVFRSGIEKIIERTPVPVVPMALQGLWGSFFSNCGGAALTHAPRLRWSSLGLVVGEPVAPEDVRAEDLRARVLALRGERR
jgi:1-acyl-sn-glycerol-3-phosphate acyltransferase